MTTHNRKLIITLSLQERQADGKTWRHACNRSTTLRIGGTASITSDQMDAARSLIEAAMVNQAIIGDVERRGHASGVVSQGAA